MFRSMVLAMSLSATVLGRPIGAGARDEAPAPRIEAIEIVVRDVFEDGEENEHWPYQLANRLHLETRERVIRRELLFEEGEPLDPEALEQTERNLRSLPFLRDARVETRPTSTDGRIRVRVETMDSWSTLPEVRLAKVGNEWVWGAGFTERNLFGHGKTLQVLRDAGLDREETFGLYQDPRLFGTRFAFGGLVSSASDGHRLALGLDRPFFELDTLWSLKLLFEDFDRLDPLYEDGLRVDSLRHRRQLGEIGAGRAVLRSEATVVRLHAGYRFSEDDVSLERRRFGALRFGVSGVTHRFLKLTHLNRFERPEDINLGPEWRATFGISTQGLGGEPGTAYFFALSERAGLRLGREGFLLGILSWQGRRRSGELENNLARARVHAVQKLSQKKVVLAKADLVYGHGLDPELQVRLGAESGLRGYPVRQFNGDRSLLLSAEARWFLADDVLRLVSLGVAAFADSGFAWAEGTAMALSDLRSDVGVSLLLGGNRVSASRPGVRIDVAYALDPIPGRSRWLVSAGSSLEF